jgi:plastocyanin
MFKTDPARLGRAPLLAVAAASLLLLGACNATSFSPGGQSSAPSGGAARCEVTPDATAAATNSIASFAFGDDVTVNAGQAVAFANGDGVGHTVTEGTGGTAAANACVDQPVAAGATVTVTFNEAGDFQITCKIHHTMQTVVHVQ